MVKIAKKKIIYPNAYLINVDRWICSCKYFLTSRFTICKHLIHLKGSVYKNYFKKFLYLKSKLLIVMYKNALFKFRFHDLFLGDAGAVLLFVTRVFQTFFSFILLVITITV